jgi:hypothetical protein
LLVLVNRLLDTDLEALGGLGVELLVRNLVGHGVRTWRVFKSKKQKEIVFEEELKFYSDV